MINIREALANPKVVPAALAFVLQRELGDAWKEWEPEVLWDEITEHTGVEQYPRANRDKIMAIRLLFKTNVPWQDWHPFLTTALALNGAEVSSEVAQTVSPSYLAYAISIMRRMSPENEFDRDVRYMIAAMLHSEGIYWVPLWPMGGIIPEEMEFFQSETDHQKFADLAAIDYLNVNPSTDFNAENPIRMHTVKLLAMDAYLKEKAAEEESTVS